MQGFYINVFILLWLAITDGQNGYSKYALPLKGMMFRLIPLTTKIHASALSGTQR